MKSAVKYDNPKLLGKIIEYLEDTYDMFEFNDYIKFINDYAIKYESFNIIKWMDTEMNSNRGCNLITSNGLDMNNLDIIKWGYHNGYTINVYSNDFNMKNHYHILKWFKTEGIYIDEEESYELFIKKK